MSSLSPWEWPSDPHIKRAFSPLKRLFRTCPATRSTCPPQQRSPLKAPTAGRERLAANGPHFVRLWARPLTHMDCFSSDEPGPGVYRCNMTTRHVTAAPAKHHPVDPSAYNGRNPEHRRILARHATALAPVGPLDGTPA